MYSKDALNHGMHLLNNCGGDAKEIIYSALLFFFLFPPPSATLIPSTLELITADKLYMDICLGFGSSKIAVLKRL